MSLCGNCTKSNWCDNANEDVSTCDRFSISFTNRYCHNCAHWRELRTVKPYYNPKLIVTKLERDCALQSCECVTDVFNHRLPRRYQNVLESV